VAAGTAVEVVMPQMGVSVSEGTVTQWLKAIGETVAPDEPLLEISTDKVDTEVPSPAGGVLIAILVAEGETVDVGTVIGTLQAGEGAAVAAPVAPADPEPTAVAPNEPAGDATPVAEASTDDEQRSFVSPVVARIAAEHSVEISAVPGTGRGGRVTKKDILSFVESGAPSGAAAPASVPAPAVATPAPAAPTAAPAAPKPAQKPPEPAQELAPGEHSERLTVMRRAISEHMRHSLEVSAPVTTAFEIDMSRVVAIRQRLKGEYAEQHGVRLTYLALITRAAIDAVTQWPWINGEIRGNQIITRSYINVGIAVALDDAKGLIVPVIKNAEEKNLLGIARAIEDLADRARSKKLSPDDVQGGTFTITNPGGFGAILGTPIINQPQSAILDVEAIVKRPWVVTDENGNDSIAIKPMMNLCLTYDHRLIDGAYAAPFMRDLRTNLETWDESRY
jgi:pyruvate dehydrogenase E2 component (dihydrolipoamide acetyltransferase)